MLDQIRASSDEWAKIESDENFATEDKTREARMEKLKKDFKEYSELLYSTASARLHSVSLSYYRVLTHPNIDAGGISGSNRSSYT